MSKTDVPSAVKMDKAVLCPECDAAPCGYAAKELRRLLSSAGVTVMAGGVCPVDAVEIVLRETDDASLSGGAFRLIVTDGRITLECCEHNGFVYGCYALLEKAGFRFFTQDCEVIPHAPLFLPRGTFEEHPAFEAREVFWRSALDGAFAVRLRLNSSRASITPEQGGKAMFYNFSHTFNALVPVEKYFDTHPEYFSMIDEVRCRERTQLCLTNPDVLGLCVQGVIRWKKEHPAYHVFSVAMNDWYNNCRCPACRAVDEEEGSGAGTMIRFVNAVAENVEKVFPDVSIHTFAYLYCRKPPRLTRPRKNVIVRLCAIECCYSHPMEECRYETGPIDVQYTSARAFAPSPDEESTFVRDLRGWGRICDQLYIWDYTTNYANYLQPFPNLRVLAPNLRLFRSCGVKGVLEQGNFSLGKTTALGDLKVYLLSRLLWDPDQDPQALIDDFCAGCYGEGAGHMLRYIAILEDAAKSFHMGIYDAPDAPYLSDQVLHTAEECLEAALAVTTGDAHTRILREQLSLRYVRLAREVPDTPGHAERVDAFAADAKALGITELFERRDLEGSFRVLKTSYLTRDRSCAEPITYPF